MFYISALDNNGGIYKVDFNKEKVEKIAANGGPLCKRAHSLANYCNHSIAFTDVDDFCVKVFNPVTKEVFVLVGEGCGTCDGSKAQFAQPTGLCFEMKTLFVVGTSTGSLRMTSSAKSLLSYLKHLEMFAVTFELHIRKEVPVVISLQDAIDRVQMVYAFDKKCVDDLKALTGTSATTQGPQGTVSSVVIDDEKRLLNSLKQIKQLLDRFEPSLKTKFSIKSILTLVVENTFSEMRAGASNMPLQFEFDYRFCRSMKERLKRQCSTPYSCYTSKESYYPQLSISVKYSDLPRLHPPRANKLSANRVQKMRLWRALYGQSVPQKTVRNMSTKDNPGTLPINLYAAEPPKMQPIDLTELAHPKSTEKRSNSEEEIQEFVFFASQIVCIESDKECQFVIASLLENVTVIMKKVKVLVFSPDPFNLLHYVEDIQESFEVRHILCILQSCKKIEDVLEIAEEEYLDLQEEVIKAVERVTSDEATEITNQTDATTFEQSTRHSTRRKKRRPNDDFFYYE